MFKLPDSESGMQLHGRWTEAKGGKAEGSDLYTIVCLPHFLLVFFLLLAVVLALRTMLHMRGPLATSLLFSLNDDAHNVTGP